MGLLSLKLLLALLMLLLALLFVATFVILGLSCSLFSLLQLLEFLVLLLLLLLFDLCCDFIGREGILVVVVVVERLADVFKVFMRAEELLWAPEE